MSYDVQTSCPKCGTFTGDGSHCPFCRPGLTRKERRRLEHEIWKNDVCGRCTPRGSWVGHLREDHYGGKCQRLGCECRRFVLDSEKWLRKRQAEPAPEGTKG